MSLPSSLLSPKYSKLSDDILLKKINGSVKSLELSVPLINRIDELTNEFNRVEAECICNELEVYAKEMKTKKQVEKEKERLAKFRTEQSIPKIIEETEETIRERLCPKIMTDSQFKQLKSSFGIMMEDENEQPLYKSLDAQFYDTMNSNSLTLYRVTYNKPMEYDENIEFRLININKGFVQQFGYLNNYLFNCFRFYVNTQTNECIYSSLWIVNTKASMFNLLGFDSELFTFEKIEYGFTTNVEMKDTFIRQFRKTIKQEQDTNNGILLIDETYLR